MDLPSCPACNQSVLDDDAIHCPFCGASMSGDGTNVPVQQHPTLTPAQTDSEHDEAATDDSPQPTSPTTQPKSAPTPSIDDTDPFAVDPAASKQAVPAAPKPTRKRTWRVHCPMCDTPGFLPRQAAGHDVKCANPECLVPIFTAPASSDETPKPPEPDNPETTNAAGGRGPVVALLLIAVAGAAATGWWFLTRPPDTTSNDPHTPIIDPITTADPFDNTSNTTDPAQTAKDNPGGTATTKQTHASNPDSTAITVETIRLKAPPLMVAAAQQRDRNRSKPFCRRLTAEYFARIGRTDAAHAELKQLAQIGSDLPHLHINALVQLWWHQQSPGTAKPGPQLEQAIQKATHLSPSNPFAVDAAITLACALIASDQVALADFTINRLWNPSLPSQLRLDQLQCQQDGTFHLDNRLTHLHSMQDDPSPDRLVIARLCSHQHSTAALKWSLQAGTASARANRIAAWAVATRQINSPSSAKSLELTLAEQSPAVTALVHARMALDAAGHGDPDAANHSIQQAQMALRICPETRTVALGNLKQTLQGPIDDVSGWWLKAQAQAELLGALCLTGQLDPARSLLTDTLATARSLGPAQTDIANKLKAIKSAGTNRLVQQVKAMLELTDDDLARQAATQYTSKCRDWMKLAQQRSACLDRLHRWAILHGLGSTAWDDIREHGLTNDTTIRDPFLASTLPSFLFLNFQAAGNTDSTTAMNQALPAGLTIDATETLRQTAHAALKQGNLGAVSQAINADASSRRDRIARFDRRRVLFELVAVAAASDSPKHALQLAGSIRDPRLAIWREEAYRLVAAQLAARHHHAIAWNFARHADRLPTETVALLAGLLEGLPPEKTPNNKP
jgi:hypothetical protein